VLGSDGIFDKLTNEEIIRAGWVGLSSIQDPMICYKQAVDSIMTQSLLKRTQDNISTVLIAFKNLEDLSRQFNYEEQIISEIELDESNLYNLIDLGEAPGQGQPQKLSQYGLKKKLNASAMDLEEIDSCTFCSKTDVGMGLASNNAGDLDARRGSSSGMAIENQGKDMSRKIYA
jgi:hypothetical protein